MLNPEALSTYKSLRARGSSPASALDFARRPPRPDDARELRALDGDIDGAVFTRNGWEITVRVHEDEVPDFSHWGEVTDKWEKGAIPLTAKALQHYGLESWHRTDGAYFVPPYRDGWEHHYTADSLHFLGQLRNGDAYVRGVVVTAHRAGVELGTGSIWGVEITVGRPRKGSFRQGHEDATAALCGAVSDHCLVEEAIEEAKRTLKLLCDCPDKGAKE